MGRIVDYNQDLIRRFKRLGINNSTIISSLLLSSDKLTNYGQIYPLSKEEFDLVKNNYLEHNKILKELLVF